MIFMTFFCFMVAHYKKKLKIGSDSRDISAPTSHRQSHGSLA
jgi:hypothetical protein